MITISIPVWPTAVAIAVLICFIFVLADEGGSLGDGFVPLVAAVFSFFLFHGILSMFGAY